MTKQVLDIGELVITFEENSIIHFHFKKTDSPTELTTIRMALSILKGNVDDKAYLLITTEEGATMSQEARELASSEEFDKVILADAIVRTDYSHEMAANFFIRFNKPHRPVKLFSSKEKALRWIEEIRDK